MAADTEFSVFHGASPGTPTNINSTTLRHKRADNDTQDAVDPIPVPTAGFNYGWQKSFTLRVGSTGPDNEIRNLRYFSEGQVLGTDRTLRATRRSTYTQGSAADESSEVTGDIATVDIDTYTTGSPLTMNGGAQIFGAAETGDGTQDFFIVQARVGPTAVAGNVAAAKGITARYDES